MCKSLINYCKNNLKNKIAKLPERLFSKTRIQNASKFIDILTIFQELQKNIQAIDKKGINFT